MVNPETLTCFIAEQGNLLIRLIIAHLLSDFALQSNAMVQNKKVFSPYMALHIGILGILTWLLCGEWTLALTLGCIHWLIDSMKLNLLMKLPQYHNKLFIADQLLHILTIILIWSWHFDVFNQLLECLKIPIAYYPYSLYLLAYLILIYPVSYLIKFTTQSLSQSHDMPVNQLEHGGMRIGQFERVIILTLVIFNQFEAIGFLITGKSIIRFADHNSNLKSEYVLVGTMMSYAFAILTGVGVNYLIALYKL